MSMSVANLHADQSLSGNVRHPRPLEPLVEERCELRAHRLRLRRELLLLRAALLLLVSGVVLASLLGGGGGGGRLLVWAGAALLMI